MGLGYALSENFTSTNAIPDSLMMRDCGIVRAKDTPQIDAILIEIPDEIGGYGAKGAGEIGLVATAGAVAGCQVCMRDVDRRCVSCSWTIAAGGGSVGSEVAAEDSDPGERVEPPDFRKPPATSRNC